jgi:hypothetical protein
MALIQAGGLTWYQPENMEEMSQPIHSAAKPQMFTMK